MNKEERVRDLGREGVQESTATDSNEFRVPDDLEAYFDRVEAERGERAAAEMALAEAERMSRVQGDRSMHLTDSSRETINGALTRIGGELSQGRDAGEALNDIRKEIARLQTEERAALVALRAELPPASAPVAEEPAAAMETPAVTAPSERADHSQADAWTADERRDVSTYLDSIDATDRVHTAYMKSVREMKKIDKASPDWSTKAAEVNRLEQQWKDAKTKSRALEDKLGPKAGELTALDVGRKAGRDALRERIAAMAAPVEAPAPTETAEPEPAPEEPPAVEANETTAAASEELFRELDEIGDAEVTTAADAHESLLPIFAALEERAAQRRRVREFSDALFVDVSRLEAWKNAWAASLASLANGKDALTTMPRERAGEFLGIYAAQAETAEAEIRAIQADFEERFRVANEDLDAVDGNKVIPFESENLDRIAVIIATVTKKRDAIDLAVRRIASSNEPITYLKQSMPSPESTHA